VLGKAAFFTLVAVSAFWLQSASAFALLGAAASLLAALARLPQRLLWGSLRPLLLLALFTVLAGAFANHPGATLLCPEFSWPGLHTGALYAARLLLITLLTTLFFLTTRPDDAISLGVRLLAPLRLIGISARELSLLVHLAYRFVPLLARELEEMRWGRLARNLPGPSGPCARAQQAAETVIAVVIGSLQRAEITAMAMQQRGLLDSWRPLPLGRGRLAALWPLLTLAVLSGILLRVDERLL
jgi:energy-coupling factor transporter transmembrane protein EcfT